MEGDSIAVEFINSLPKEKLILVDKLLPGIQGSYGAVYENFEKDIYQTLVQAKDALAKYQALQLVFPESSYYPKGIIKGFEHFCRDFAFDFSVVENVEPQRGTAYITVMEDDLIALLDQIKEKAHNHKIDNIYTLASDIQSIPFQSSHQKNCERYILRWVDAHWG